MELGGVHSLKNVVSQIKKGHCMTTAIASMALISTLPSDTFGIIRQELLYVPVPNEPDLPLDFPFRPVADGMPAYRVLAVLFQLQHEQANMFADLAFSDADFPAGPEGFSDCHFMEIPFNLLLALWRLRSFFPKASNSIFCGQQRLRWSEDRWVVEKAELDPLVGDFVLGYYRPK
jgi:hypothetical protein